MLTPQTISLFRTADVSTMPKHCATFGADELPDANLTYP
jgi:hypothetical protein